MNLLHFDELPATPWKNGGGITRELASFPQGAGLDDFVWRVSIADIGKSGPFSHFPGVDRIIMLLTGDGMELRGDDGLVYPLTTPLQPFRFPGDSHIDATLVGEPSLDFNLMLRREQVDGEIRIWRDAADIGPDDGIVLLYCAAGAWQVGAHRLGACDTLVGAPDAATRLQPLQDDSALVGVRIMPRAAFDGNDHE